MRSTRTAAPVANSAARVVPTTQTARARRRRRAAPFFDANTPRRLITHYDARDADAQESKGRGAAALVQDLERPRNIKRGAAPVQGRADDEERTGPRTITSEVPGGLRILKIHDLHDRMRLSAGNWSPTSISPNWPYSICSVASLRNKAEKLGMGLSKSGLLNVSPPAKRRKWLLQA